MKTAQINFASIHRPPPKPEEKVADRPDVQENALLAGYRWLEFISKVADLEFGLTHQ